MRARDRPTPHTMFADLVIYALHSQTKAQCAVCRQPTIRLSHQSTGLTPFLVGFRTGPPFLKAGRRPGQTVAGMRQGDALAQSLYSEILAGPLNDGRLPQ